MTEESEDELEEWEFPAEFNLKEFVQKYIWVIVGVCIMMMLFAAFKAGVLYACQGGYLDGFRCVQPQVMEASCLSFGAG